MSFPIGRGTESIHTRIERERRAAAPSKFSWSDLKRFREYARGRQRGTLNADQIRILQSVIGNKFSDNILKMIVSVHANRLRIARYDVEDDTVRDFIFDTWVKNQLPDLFADAIFATIRDGNHAVSLNWLPIDDPDDEYGGRVVLLRERWWDGTEGIFVMYGDDGRPAYAVKEWKTLEGLQRRNVYFPEVFFRYVFDGGSWQPYALPGDPLAQNELGEPVSGVIPWIKRDGAAIGIPIIHIANGSDDDSFYGASLLDGGPLAFQDQINAIQHDITAAAMLNGSPQTYSRGFMLPPDPEDPTKKLRIVTGPGAHHHNDEATAEWGVIPGGDVSTLRDSYNLKIEAVCRNTSTPNHLITGQWPSGEAIFRAEMPLVQSTRKLAESVGPAASSIMHRATEIANTFGRGPYLDEDALIQTRFEPPEQRDALALWAVAEKAAPYVSTEEVLRMVGKTPDEIKAIMDEREAENERKLERAQTVFSRGPLVPGTDVPETFEDEDEDESE